MDIFSVYFENIKIVDVSLQINKICKLLVGNQSKQWSLKFRRQTMSMSNCPGCQHHFASPSTMSVKLDKQIRAIIADYKRITPQELKKGSFLEKYLGVGVFNIVNAAF
jgi:hypothetical protein